MASKLADEIYTAILSTDADQPYATVAFDAELAEVREVLDGLQTFQMNLSSEGTERHWCNPNGGCNEHCQRARALYERLNPNVR